MEICAGNLDRISRICYAENEKGGIMMKRKISVLLLICFCTALFGCGREKTIEEKIAEFPLPEKTEISAETPVQDWEFILPNGVFFGMDYDMVKAVCDNDVLEYTSGSEDYKSFLKDGIFYSFVKNSDGAYILKNLSIQDTEEENGPYGIVIEEPILRGLGIGDALTEFLAAVPAEDATLRRAEWQYVYGPNEDGYTALEFVANSYYALRFVTSSDYMMMLTFSRKGQKLLWVETYDNSEADMSAANA